MLAAARNVVAARIRFDLSPCSRALIVTGPNRSGQKIRQTRIPRLFCCVRTTVTCVHAETRQFREFPPDVIKISLGGVRVSATDSTGFSLCAFVTFAVPRLCMFDRTAAREMVFVPRRTDRNSSCGYLVATVDLWNGSAPTRSFRAYRVEGQSRRQVSWRIWTTDNGIVTELVAILFDAFQSVLDFYMTI